MTNYEFFSIGRGNKVVMVVYSSFRWNNNEEVGKKGLVKKICSPEDRRHVIVSLSTKGQRVFEREFPRQIAYLKQRFDLMTKKELKEAEHILMRLTEIFS